MSESLKLQSIVSSVKWHYYKRFVKSTCGSQSLNFFLKFILFIYFWLCWVFVAVRGPFLVAASRGYSSLWCAGFSLQWFLLCSTGSRRTGFSSCGTRAQQLQCTGLVALRHVGSSQTRAQTRVLCIGRRILNHCATKEAPPKFFFLIMENSS